MSKSFSQPKGNEQPKSEEEKEEEEKQRMKEEALDPEDEADGGGAPEDQHRRDTRPPRPRAGRPGAGQDPDSGDRRPAGRRPPPAPVRHRDLPADAAKFTGSPGTGETTVAIRMAELLSSLGYLSKGHLTSVTRDDLVGQYIGHTAPKTKEVLKKARGGVLFIDEAYYLYRPDNERDYGQETIEILLQVMEEERENIVVILAGYKDKMDVFFKSNPGMGSRIAHHIDFPDFTLDELWISPSSCWKSRSTSSPRTPRRRSRRASSGMQQPRFANGRSVRNAIERARLRHASRVVRNADKVNKADLMTIEAEDIYKSRLFTEDEHDIYGDGQGEDGQGEDGEEPEGERAEAEGEEEAEEAKAETDGQADGESEDEAEDREESKAGASPE